MPRVTAHLTPETISSCKDRGSVSEGINRMVRRYVFIVESSHQRQTLCERMSTENLDALRDIVRSWDDTQIAVALDAGMSEHKDIKGTSIENELSALELPDQIALIDAIERHWKRASDSA